MEKLKALIGDRTDDEALTFIEDVSDTVEANKSEEDWKTKYEENDKMWREKYRDRFYNGNDENDDDTDDKKDTNFRVFKHYMGILEKILPISSCITFVHLRLL